MLERVFAPLSGMLSPHFTLGKSRLQTFVVLIVGLVNTRTVNLSHLASQFPSDALHASNYRRLQRFFQHVRLAPEEVAPLVIRMLNLGRPKMLALDRTNWKLGAKHINILMLAVVTRRFRVPLLWTVLDRAGNSDTAERVALVRRYMALFGVGSIELLLADREFIGADWMEFLNENNIPFAIRLRESMRVRLAKEHGKRECKFCTLMRRRHSQRRVTTWSGWLNGMEQTPDHQLSFAARRIRGADLIIIATNTGNPARALNAYRKRWGVECLFADAKTRGFNIEDTHLVDPGKISTMLAVLALAITWAYRCATQKMGRRAIARRTHGRREKSWFRIGFDTLRNWIIHHPDKAINSWAKTCPKYPKKSLRTA